MGLEFDPINKYILVTSPTTTLTALEVYNATMDWCDDQPTMSYSVPMRAVGKAPLGGGVYTDSIFVLQDGWKIKFWSGTYQAVITGTLITDDETPRTVPPDSGNVEVVFQVSSQGTVIPDVAEWTQIEKNGIISDVDVIQAKTENLPTDPASESAVLSVNADLGKHDADIKGTTWTDESLKKIKELIEAGTAKANFSV